MNPRPTALLNFKPPNPPKFAKNRKNLQKLPKTVIKPPKTEKLTKSPKTVINLTTEKKTVKKTPKTIKNCKN